MRAVLCLTALLCCYTAAAVRNVPASGLISNPELGAPWFCHDIDCPQFSVTAKYGDLELRSYQGGAWVSTNISDVSYDKAVKIGFMRLFGYISGDNVERKKVEMTAPVKTLCRPSQGPFCESSFTVSFFVPFELQRAPPQPFNATVFIDQVEAASFYVLSYPGYTKESTVVAKASEAVGMLDAAKLPYNGNSFFAASYDPPFRLLGRHNEVWIPVK